MIKNHFLISYLIQKRADSSCAVLPAPFLTELLTVYLFFANIMEVSVAVNGKKVDMLDTRRLLREI
jgi:hypothetical protein